MRKSQMRGDQGQNQAAAFLSELGIQCVERVGTPMKLTPFHLEGRKDVYSVRFGEKVSGDHRGVFPDGRSFLAETKTIYGRNLQYGDLRPHQPGKLSEHAKAGGISALVWVHDNGICAMQWLPHGIPGFEAGKGITVDRAKDLYERFLYVLAQAQKSTGYFRCSTCGDFWYGKNLHLIIPMFGPSTIQCGNLECGGEVQEIDVTEVISALSEKALID